MHTGPSATGQAPPPASGGAATFRTTRWTEVRRSQSDSPEGRHALKDLCEAYYEPVAVFLRWEFKDPDLAREAAHDFFLTVLEGGAFDRADPARGRFRSYLLGAVKHFLSHRRAAAARFKRGSGAIHQSIDQGSEDLGNEGATLLDESELTPDLAFDRQWALTVLARALHALRLECDAEGRGAFFDAIKPWLTGEAAHGDQAELATRFGLNPNSMKVAVHRLKRRFRAALKDEVAGTVEDPAAVEAEMVVLFEALRP